MVPHSQMESGKPSSQPPGKRDYRKEPFQRFVAFGASITAGGSATSRELCWVNRVTDAINESQLEPLKTINVGLGASVISPRSAGYDKSTKPSSMERYQKHVVDYRPDLVTISYAVNDARAGTPYWTVSRRPSPYRGGHQEQDGRDHRDTQHPFHDRFCPGSAVLAGEYRRFRRLQLRHEAPLGGVRRIVRRHLFRSLVLLPGPWTRSTVCTPNNLGHKLIADCVFDMLAAKLQLFVAEGAGVAKNLQAVAERVCATEALTRRGTNTSPSWILILCRS